MEAIASTLGLNVAGLVWHAINFIVLLVLLRMVLFKPVRGMLDDRRRRVQESMQQAEQARRAAEQAEADRQQLLAETRQEAERIRSLADEQSKRIIGEAGGRAQEEANRILSQARAQIDQDRQQMLAEVRAQVADLVVVAVDRVTRGALDASMQRNLVQQFLATDSQTSNGSRTPAQ
jgi:F-type H+-transporting ATPase subunit b